MLVKWICLSLLQIGKDLLTVLIILPKHVKYNSILTTKSAFITNFYLFHGFVSLFPLKFIAFLNAVKPLKKGRDSLERGGLIWGGGWCLIEDLSYLCLVISKFIIWRQLSNHVTSIKATLPSRTLSLVIYLQQACNMSCSV